jgi:hypothetical protein
MKKIKLYTVTIDKKNSYWNLCGSSKFNNQLRKTVNTEIEGFILDPKCEVLINSPEYKDIAKIENQNENGFDVIFDEPQTGQVWHQIIGIIHHKITYVTKMNEEKIIQHFNTNGKTSEKYNLISIGEFEPDKLFNIYCPETYKYYKTIEEAEKILTKE